MVRRVIAAVAMLCLASAGSAMAQSRVQASVFAGWTVSDGVTGDPFRAPDGNTYSAIDAKDSGMWGFSFGVNATPNVEVGFLFGQQMSTLGLEGSADRELGDLTINTYHPYLAYNFGDEDYKVRPYILFGLGATSYGNVDYRKATGETASTGGETQFSTTWGAGVKLYPSPKVGVQLGLQWTPTYIKSDAGGWWCDPYWGCYVVGDAQYSNQLHFTGGIAFRF